MDGLELTREIRDRGWSIPTMALTAHAMQGDGERLRIAGIDTCIPLGPRTLIETIRRLRLVALPSRVDEMDGALPAQV